MENTLGTWRQRGSARTGALPEMHASEAHLRRVHALSPTSSTAAVSMQRSPSAAPCSSSVDPHFAHTVGRHKVSPTDDEDERGVYVWGSCRVREFASLSLKLVLVAGYANSSSIAPRLPAFFPEHRTPPPSRTS